MKPKIEDLMTVGELKRALEGAHDDDKVFFGCFSLQFYRTKYRGDNLLQIEFNQSVYDDETGKVYIDNH
jgi:hypothetical protein